MYYNQINEIAEYLVRWGRTIVLQRSTNNGSFTVGEWLVEPDLDRITRDTVTTNLRPQVMELLVYLSIRDGEVVSNEELLDELWPGRIVTDSTVYNCVAELRHALADGKETNDYIATVPKKGYRLTAPVKGMSLPETRDRTIPLRLGWVALISAGLIGALVAAGWNYFEPIARDRTTSQRQESVTLPLHLPDFADSRLAYTWNSFALSPDGRQIAYIGYDGSDIHLYLKTAGAARARIIPGTKGAAVPFFSPDGEWLGFFADEKLMRVSTSGGLPLEIGSAKGPPVGANWGDDDRIYFNVGFRSHQYVIPSAGGHAELLIELSPDGTTHREPHVLPGGETILYQLGSPGSVMQSQPTEIWAMELDSHEKQFVTVGAEPKYSNDRLFFTKVENEGRKIWSIAFDPDSLRVSGDAVPLPIDPVESFDLSRSGAIIYTQPRPMQNYSLRIVDTDGTALLLTDEHGLSHPRFSPDGSSLAISIGPHLGKNVWIFDLSGTRPPYQLTTDGGAFQVWKPDGLEIAYYKWGEGIFTQALDSTAEPRRLIPEKGFSIPMDWTDNGFLYLRPAPEPSVAFSYRSTDRGLQSIDSGFKVPIEGTMSPNGRWIAYAAMDSGIPYVYVKAVMHGTRKWRVSAVSGRNPKWAADGRRLYFASFDKIMSIDVSDENWRADDDPIVEHVYSGRADITFDGFDVSPDGKRFAVVNVKYGPSPGITYVSNAHRLSTVLD